MKKQVRAKFSDPLIVPRVKNYLAENVDKTFVDVGEMARSLKERYREYSNRSEGAFCQMVEGAYKVVLQSYGLDEGSSNSEEEDSDDLELLDDSNVLNDQLMTMYKGPGKTGGTKKDKQDKTSELIDISSDEDSSSAKGAKVAKLSDQVTIELCTNDGHKMNNKNQISIENITSTSTPQTESKKRKVNQDGPRPSSQKKRDKPEEVEVPKEEVEAPKEKVKQAKEDSSKVSLEDIGGMERISDQIYELMLQVKHPEVYGKLGGGASRGVLLHGPPGTGKTLLAHCLVGTLGLPLVTMPATELIGGLSGESEKNIRDLFEKAAALSPCALFIDEIDSISGNRLTAQKDMEKRIVSQLLSSLDSLHDKNVLVICATSQPEALDPALRRAGRLELEIPLGIPTRAARKDILKILLRNISKNESVDLDDVARLTPGYVGADLKALVNKACATTARRIFQQIREHTNLQEDTPSTEEPLHQEVLAVTETLPVDQNEKVNGEMHEGSEKEEKSTEGGTETESPQPQPCESSETSVAETQPQEAPQTNKVVGGTSSGELNMADLHTYLTNVQPLSEEQLAAITVSMEDILVALKTTKPSAIREGFATVPDVTWDDVGSLQEVRRELQLSVLAPVKYPEQLESLGLGVPSGVLLCGPPGCGKTLLAKAVANEAGINFISVKGPELLNMYVGESERAVRTCFQRARNSAPCVIFFDEFDSLCPRRGSGDTSGASRVVNQLLTEMDGVEGRNGVFVLAASNRPDIIDPAVLRPGRLERVLFVGLPKSDERVDILKALTRKGPVLAENVRLESVGQVAENFTGADLAGLVRAAATEALLEFITGGAQPHEGPLKVSALHFQKAFLRVRPSVSQKELQHYDKLRIKYATPGESDVEMETEESMDTI